MASPQRQLPPDPAPQPPEEYVDTHARSRGPRFRWWWLWAIIIIGTLLWYFGFHWNTNHGWYQRHTSNPSSTAPTPHPHTGTSAEAASRNGGPQQNSGAMSRREASETGNGQGQSLGRTAPQSSARNNSVVGH